MRVLAARFQDEATASRLQALLSQRYQLGTEDVSIGPLRWDEDGTVLAGRFREERVADVRALIERNGGEVLSDVDEARTRPLRRRAS